MTQLMKVNELEPAPGVNGIYLVTDIQFREKRDGGTFVSLSLRDRTGQIDGIMWENIFPFVNKSVGDEDFVRVVGDVGVYQGKLQFTLRSIEKVDDRKVNIEDFLPRSPRDKKEMLQELEGYVLRVEKPYLRQLLDSFFGDATFLEKFALAPSARSMHQAYIGGLLEHTLGVAKNALSIAQNYRNCDIDLLLTGVLLHDMGKVYEFEYTKCIRYSDIGRLVGHLSLGLLIVDKKIDGIKGFPDTTRIEIRHMLISHHGLKDYGSPKSPKTIEALILHYSDYIDAYLSTYLEETRKAKEKNETWTEWQRMFERYLFAGFPENSKG